jgi:outer membrane lipopolysaccharide assembly protein LptE/RlpB
MNIKRFAIAIASLAAGVLVGCKVTYSLSGASIPANAKTVSIPYFPNNATLVSPTLSATLTDELQTRFTNQTKLELVPENGDLAFEGEITNYSVQPVAVTSNDVAAENRLTITVKVKFTNRIDPTFDFNKSFSAFQQYPSSSDLSSVEGALIPELVSQLVDDIFNAAVANW